MARHGAGSRSGALSFDEIKNYLILTGVFLAIAVQALFIGGRYEAVIAILVAGAVISRLGFVSYRRQKKP